MSDWTPEDVDALFQEGSTKHEFEYNEAAWGQMENLLDRRDKRRRLVWWFFGLGASLLIILLYFGINGYLGGQLTELEKTTLELESSTTPTKVITEKEKKATTSIIEIAETTKLQEQSEKIGKVQTTLNSSLKKDSKEVVAKNRNSRIDRDSEVRKVEKQKEISTSLENKENSFTVSEETNKTEEVDEPNDQKNDLTEVSNSIFEKQTQNFSSQVSELSNLPTLSFSLDAPNRLIDFDSLTFEKITDPVKSLSDNHFVIGVLLGSEASFTETNALCRPTWKAGLSVEYRFGRKHALKLGANYIRKDYRTNNAANYRAPAGFWENGVAPQSVMANCDVLELTLSETYFFKGHAQKGFYINGGLTSYLMLEEIYNYSYENPPTNARMRWGTQNTNQHWMGIAEVSFGYNLPFTDKSSLQIAPYAQIPLTGVGHGQLKLFSSGVLVRYNFHVR